MKCLRRNQQTNVGQIGQTKQFYFETLEDVHSAEEPLARDGLVRRGRSHRCAPSVPLKLAMWPAPDPPGGMPSYTAINGRDRVRTALGLWWVGADVDPLSRGNGFANVFDRRIQKGLSEIGVVDDA